VPDSPKRIRLSRAKGWRMPPDTVKVDRATKWGNPFIVGVHGTRAECVELYRLMLAELMAMGNANLEEQRIARAHLVAHITELRGKDLACWCNSDGPCHADALLEIANRDAAP
jgi:hypothetical protein